LQPNNGHAVVDLLHLLVLPSHSSEQPRPAWLRWRS
jgi:hypothetical protein